MVSVTAMVMMYFPTFALMSSTMMLATEDVDIIIAVPQLQTDVEDDLIHQRASAVRDIAIHINEIQSIFKKLLL
jgi:hypothetical protein